MAGGGHAQQADPAVGLCSLCRNARHQRNPRGSAFWRCAASDRDPRLLRYPPLPVTACHAFAAKGSGEPGA